MRFRPLCLLLSCTLFLATLWACNRHANQLAVERTNIADEVALQQNLSFTFNRDVVPDSLIGHWDSTAYFTIVPQVEGAFKWVSATELVFSPTSGFAPSTRYVAVPAAPLAARAKGVSLSADTIAFHTPYLQMESAAPFWIRDVSGTTTLRVGITFNYGIVDETAAAHLHITDADGKRYPTKFERLAEGNTVYLTLENTKVDPATDLYVIAERGIKTTASTYATTADAKLQISIPTQQKLEILDVSGIHNADGNVVHVTANQQIGTSDIKQYITIDPALPFTISPSDNGFDILADYNPAIGYTVTIGKELQGIVGGAMGTLFSQTVGFLGVGEPSIKFVNTRGQYLSTEGSRNVAVQIIGLSQVKVTISKVFDNNLIHYLRAGRYGTYDGEENYATEYGYEDDADENFGALLFSKTYSTKDLAVSHGAQILHLELPPSQMRGVYIVRVANPDELYTNATKFISISDIGLIAHASENECTVFANSIATTKPLANVAVKLMSRNSQVLATATTDGEGKAVLKGYIKTSPGYTPILISATQKSDYNYLNFSDNTIATSRFDVGGLSLPAGGYQTFIYGERNLYRPGETAHLNIIVRNATWDVVQGLPIKIKVTQPGGGTFLNLRQTLNTQSATPLTFAIPDGAVTGTYAVEVYTAKDVLIGHSDLSIEEFLPDRLHINASVPATAATGQALDGQFQANNLYGTPAADRNWQVRLVIEKMAFNPKAFPEYDFTLEGEDAAFSGETKSGRTAADGRFSASFPLSTTLQGNGLLAAKLFTTVFDEAGRPVNRMDRSILQTQPALFGIQHPASFVGTRTPVVVPIIALNASGAVQQATAHLTVVRHTYRNVIERGYEGSVSYRAQKVDVVEQDRTLAISGQATKFVFSPSQSGSYEIRVSAPGSAHYVKHELYAWSGAGSSPDAFAINPEGQVDMSADKTIYHPGDKAKVLFKTPFDGRLLITIERNRVLEHHWIATTNKAAAFTLDVSEAYLPNVYVAATLIRPNQANAIPLTVAHGYLPLTIEKPDNRLPLSITAAAKSRANTSQTVSIKSAPESDINITLAVVDEGILQIKNYKTPDAFGYFYQKRALQVEGHDIYPMLLPEIALRRSSTGGDKYNMNGRANPLANKRVKLVSYWSGVLHTNASGIATYTFDIPAFSGALRLMAVAYKNRRFGSAEASMRVADPIVATPGIARFLAPGDSLVMPLILANTTTANVQATATASATGNLRMAGEQKTLAIRAGQETGATFTVQATGLGQGQIVTTVQSAGQTYRDVTDITIRPVAGLVTHAGSGVVQPGQKVQVNLGGDFFPSTATARLVVGRTPLAQVAGCLAQLLGYPYGCAEQTISKAFPQLYFDALTRAANVKQGTTENPAANVREAIRKLATLQQPDGGLSMWEGGTETNWWVSAYAAHFLVEAARNDYEVNEDMLRNLMGYLATKTAGKAVVRYAYYDDNHNEQTRIGPDKAAIYSLYVMALAGKPKIVDMNYYRASSKALTIDARYMLACTYLLASDRQGFATLLPPTFAGEQAVNETGGNLSSYTRDMGLVLATLLSADPTNAQIPALTRRLSEQLSHDANLSTQENAVALLALGKAAQRLRSSTATATISGAGFAQNMASEQTVVANAAGKILNITAQNGPVYYSFVAQGASTTGTITPVDNMLKVRRTYRNQAGKEVPGNVFHQNDLVVVELTLSAAAGSTVENVVLSDLLPAGFEIENPRLTELPSLSWMGQRAQPEHADVRDDRVNLFVSANGTPRKYYYLARAVSVGTFSAGAVSAEAMYRPEYHSMNGGGKVRIVR